MELITTLSSTQARFILFVEDNARHLIGMWNWDIPGYNAERVENYLSIASHSECIMLRFYLGVWLNSNDNFKFDILEAVEVLEQQDMNVIIEWHSDPFWP